MASRLGVLGLLPLTDPDFASVCMTATVQRRENLRLVVVRVVESLDDGQPNMPESRSIAILFDTTHAMPALRRAIMSAIRSSSGMRESTAARVSMFTRVSAAIVPIDFNTQNSVEHESVVAGGRLRGSIHDGGAVRAYQRQVSDRATVCVSTVQRIYQKWRAEESRMQLSRRDREIAQLYTTAFQRLGVQRPTRRLIAECECSRDSTCNCFMNRAMWRAGNNWMIVYALVPPAGGQSVATTPMTLMAEAPEWLQRLSDSRAEADRIRIEGECKILAATRHAWTHSVEWYEGGMTASRVASSRKLQELFECAESSLSEVSESVSLEEVSDQLRSMQLSVGESDADLRLPQLAIALQLRRPKKAFLTEVVGLAPRLGPYFGVVVSHALLKTNSQRFEAAAMRRATEMSSSVELVVNDLRTCDGTSRAFVHAIDVICRRDNIDMSTVENCERTAHTVVVAGAMALELALWEMDPSPTKCNVWGGDSPGKTSPAM